MKKLITVFLLTMAAVAAANADIAVDFSWDNPDQTGQPGDTVQYFATITNNTAETVYFNSDNFSFTGAPSLNASDLFFPNAPISLDPGASGDYELLDITLADPFTDTFQQYSGTEVLLGGADGSALDNLASADFSITAEEPVSGTPEPASVLLAGAGLLALAVVAKRRTA